MKITCKATVKNDLLLQLNKELQANLKILAGVMGDKSKRKGDDKNSNAFIGAVQHFGSVTKRIPATNWLTLWHTHKEKEFNAFLAKQIQDNILKKNGMRKIFQNAALKLEELIDQTFTTQGFGAWPSIAQSTREARARRSAPKGIRKKQNRFNAYIAFAVMNRLIDYGFLRRSVSTKVVPADASV